MTEGLVLPGWTCSACGVFNGSAKEERIECRACDAPRDMPYVCPGCYAVGDEPCAPGCIDAEMREDAENELEMQDRILDEDDGE